MQEKYGAINHTINRLYEKQDRQVSNFSVFNFGMGVISISLSFIAGGYVGIGMALVSVGVTCLNESRIRKIGLDNFNEHREAGHSLKDSVG
jgi:hypothetical protein